MVIPSLPAWHLGPGIQHNRLHMLAPPTYIDPDRPVGSITSGQCRLSGHLTSKLSLLEESRSSCGPPSCACMRICSMRSARVSISIPGRGLLSPMLTQGHCHRPKQPSDARPCFSSVDEAPMQISGLGQQSRPVSNHSVHKTKCLGPARTSSAALCHELDGDMGYAFLAESCCSSACVLRGACAQVCTYSSGQAACWGLAAFRAVMRPGSVVTSPSTVHTTSKASQQGNICSGWPRSTGI